jgi:hypothetical protein
MNAVSDCDSALELDKGTEALELKSKSLKTHGNVNGVKMSIKQIVSTQVIKSTENNLEIDQVIVQSPENIELDNKHPDVKSNEGYIQIHSDESDSYEIIDCEYDSSEDESNENNKISELNNDIEQLQCDGNIVVDKCKFMQHDFDSDDD